MSSVIYIYIYIFLDELKGNRKFSTTSSSESESMPSIGYPFDLKKAEDQQMLGKVAPQWISKKNITNCTLCESKFTLVHRSHHWCVPKFIIYLDYAHRL